MLPSDSGMSFAIRTKWGEVAHKLKFSQFQPRVEKRVRGDGRAGTRRGREREELTWADCPGRGLEVNVAGCLD